MIEKSWDTDKDAIRHEIAGRRAPVKIVLKTKNERLFLRRWVEHHLPIVGASGLVIFDNGSDDPEVLAYLGELARTVGVYRFSTMHNSIHNTVGPLKELYPALRDSCDWYMFLDTDEYLYWAYPNGRYADDARVAREIAAVDAPAIPGIWAANAPGEDRAFALTFRGNRIPAGIRGGKPALSSTVTPTGMLGHNCKLPAELFHGSAVGNLIVAHLNTVSIEQRIAVNLEKLRSYHRTTGELGVIGIGEGPVTLDALLAADPGGLPPRNAKLYLTQLQALVAHGSFAKADSGKDIPSVRFEGGRMRFAGPKERRAVLDFLRDPAPIIAAALSVAPRR